MNNFFSMLDMRSPKVIIFIMVLVIILLGVLGKMYVDMQIKTHLDKQIVGMPNNMMQFIASHTWKPVNDKDNSGNTVIPQINNNRNLQIFDWNTPSNVASISKNITLPPLEKDTYYLFNVSCGFRMPSSDTYGQFYLYCVDTVNNYSKTITTINDIANGYMATYAPIHGQTPVSMLCFTFVVKTPPKESNIALYINTDQIIRMDHGCYSASITINKIINPSSDINKYI